MDQASRLGFYELMNHQVKEHGRTVVMVTHGLSEVQPYLDRIIELERKEEEDGNAGTTTLMQRAFCAGGIIALLASVLVFT